MSTPKEVVCAFCGLKNTEVSRMLVGEKSSICDECAQNCMNTLLNGYRSDNVNVLKRTKDDLS